MTAEMTRQPLKLGAVTAAEVSRVGRAFGASLACLFQLIVIVGYVLVAIVFGSVMMVAVPLVLAVLVIAWVVVEARLEGE